MGRRSPRSRRRSAGGVGLACALALATPGAAAASPGSAAAAAAAAVTPPDPEASQEERSGSASESASEAESEAESETNSETNSETKTGFGRAWRRCVPGVAPCTRPRPARWLLGALGVGLAALGGAYLLVVGDSLGAGDPGGYLIGGGTAALLGVVAGGLYGLTGGDRRGYADRIRPPTFAFDYASGGAPRLDERRPGEVALRLAPTYYFADGASRIRLFGHVGGIAGRQTEVDPRPQGSAPIPGQEGTHPVVLDERRLSLGVGVDLAVALPYPILRRSARLGPAELRWRPEVQIRRHHYNDRVVERTMLLPLTVGLRWHLSPRQRFTTYVGPRLDFIAFTAATAGSRGRLERGPAITGALYGEVWYDLDIPLAVRPEARAEVHGMLSVAYLHSRFDGRGINLSGAYGFLGTAYAAWNLRIRPRDRPFAIQTGIGGWFGDGFTAALSAGIVLPDLGGPR